ncbi:MAG: SAM-dependent methyltransferase [Hyphomicrobiales bacterium]|nr:SAM-dependent methyltransferase [Hyphomicrobiales bacterium]
MADGATSGKDGARPGEIAGALPDAFDAGLYFIGRCRTPFADRAACPHTGDAEAGPLCRLDIAPAFRPALAGLEGRPFILALYFMDQARRDLLVQTPHGRGPTGTFALRSPVRPNPIAASVLRLIAVEPSGLLVRGLDCVDGTPLLDIKPHRP